MFNSRQNHGTQTKAVAIDEENSSCFPVDLKTARDCRDLASIPSSFLVSLEAGDIFMTCFITLVSYVTWREDHEHFLNTNPNTPGVHAS